MGNRAGPYPAAHLSSLGITLTSLGSGFARDAPSARIIYEYDSRLPLRDFESLGHTWLISSSVRALFKRYASDAIDLAPAKVFIRYKDEEKPVGPRWLCDVIRFVDAVDEPASTIHWDVEYPRYSVGSKFVFKADVPPDCHLFRFTKAPATVACSAVLRDAILTANLSGVVLEKF